MSNESRLEQNGANRSRAKMAAVIRLVLYTTALAAPLGVVAVCSRCR